MYRRYIAKQPKEDKKAQLKELTTNSMLIAMFPIERHSKHLLVDSCRNCLRGTKLFSNEDDQNTTQKSPGRNEFIIINEDSH